MRAAHPILVSLALVGLPACFELDGSSSSNTGELIVGQGYSLDGDSVELHAYTEVDVSEVTVLLDGPEGEVEQHDLVMDDGFSTDETLYWSVWLDIVTSGQTDNQSTGFDGSDTWLRTTCAQADDGSSECVDG